MSASDPPSARREFEAYSSAGLAPWAVREADAGGRAFPEPPHPYRTCFQRDRDRIVHCSAFRRLDFKTQVFVPHESDHFRTRLTHTLEVAQIARTLGRALRLNEDLIETVALAHDLGHPPFGHAGEAALDELTADWGHFEHNRQSLRVVDYLEHPYPEFRGLNLTGVVRECLARHETRYDAPLADQFDPSLHAPMEGQLVDLADEIAYTAADLDDALAAGVLTREDLDGVALWRRAWTAAERDAPDARAIHKQIRAAKNVLSILADVVVCETSRLAAELAPDCPDAVRRAGRRCVALTGEAADMLDEMQEFLLRNVYLVDPNAEQDRRAKRIIRELFAAYVADPSRLPERYRRRIGRPECPTLQRVVCDYVAGMTDRFCRREHERLCRG